MLRTIASFTKRTIQMPRSLHYCFLALERMVFINILRIKLRLTYPSSVGDTLGILRTRHSNWVCPPGYCCLQGTLTYHYS